MQSKPLLLIGEQYQQTLQTAPLSALDRIHFGSPGQLILRLVPSTMDRTIEEIRTGLATLPQELYDQIYTNVFRAPSGQVRNINSRDLDLALKLLQISRDSRVLYARSFYDAEFEYEIDIDRFIYWLRMVHRSDRDLMRKITKGGDHLDLMRRFKEMMWAGNPDLRHALPPLTREDDWLCNVALRPMVAKYVDQETAMKVFMRIGNEDFGGLVISDQHGD